MNKKYIVCGNLDYVQGYLRYGHLEVQLTEEEYQEFINLNEEDQKDYLYNAGKLIIDDYSVEDRGEIESIEISGVK